MKVIQKTERHKIHGSIIKELILLGLCLILALTLRISEFNKAKGLPLDPDVEGFILMARKMKPFSKNGFYSGQFDMREPLFLLVVKSFLLLPGSAKDNVRYASLFFSMLAILLSFITVRTWMGKKPGLTAVFLLALHTYWITLSVRGLRSEFFTCLFITFLYFCFIKEKIDPCLRVALTGILAGMLFLTRSEFILPALIFLILMPFLSKAYWNYKRVTIAIAVGIILIAPHLISLYRTKGDPFYTANKNARFFANLEFMGRPGFPSEKDIKEHGLYFGEKITLFEYLFRLHSPKQLIAGNILGFFKIYVSFPLLYVPDYLWTDFKQGEDRYQTIKKMICHYPIKTCLLFLTGLGFLFGILILWRTKYSILYAVLFIFQIHTSFLFSIGLDRRVVVHTWPVAAWITAFFITLSFEKLMELTSGQQKMKDVLHGK